MKQLMKNKRALALRRAARTRAAMSGTAQRPRLSVKRSAKHIYAQLIDDFRRVTLVCASDHELSAKVKPIDAAREVGKAIAKKAAEKGIKQAVFDRGAYRYHGRVASLADGAREGGLSF